MKAESGTAGSGLAEINQKCGFKLGCCETDFNDEALKDDRPSGKIEYVE